jgi:hypothetical protein
MSPTALVSKDQTSPRMGRWLVAMRLTDLLQKYAGKAEHQAVLEPESESAYRPLAELPANTTQWPTEWRRKVSDNIDAQQSAFDLSPSEAKQAAEPAVRYEFAKQQGDPSGRIPPAREGVASED